MANGETILTIQGNFGSSGGIAGPIQVTTTSTYVATGADVLRPTLISNLIGVRDIVASGDMAYALMRDGSIKAWGTDNSRHMGGQFSVSKLRPTTVPGASNIRSLRLLQFLGTDDLVMLKNDGQIAVWLGYGINTIYSVITDPSFALRRLRAPPSSVRAMERSSEDTSLLFFMTNGAIRTYTVKEDSFTNDITTPFRQ